MDFDKIKESVLALISQSHKIDNEKFSDPQLKMLDFCRKQALEVTIACLRQYHEQAEQDDNRP